MRVVTLAELVKRPLTAEEAVGILVGLGERLGWATAPPDAQRVTVTSGGTIDVTPFEPQPAAPQAYAQLLHELLPEAGAGEPFHVPGALRLAVARGLGEIDLPPFPDARAFGRNVERFAGGSPAAAIATAVQRLAPSASGERRGADVDAAAPPPATAPVERRMNTPRVDVLRRLLHEGDLERHALIEAAARRAATVSARPPADAVADLPLRLVPKAVSERATPGDVRPAETARPTAARRAAPRAAAIAVALALSFGSSYLLVRALHDDSFGRALPWAADAGDREPGLEPAANGNVDESGGLGDPGDAGAASGAAAHQGGTAPPRDAAPREVATTGRTPAIARLSHPTPLPLDVVRTYSPSFAPEGDSVYFHSEQESGSRLMRADIDPHGQVTEVATVLDDGAQNFHVRVSPDGRQIAFDSDRDGERAVFVASLDGTGVRRVSAPGYAAVPTWSPDGSVIAMLRAEPRKPRVWNLWLLDLETGRERRLTDHASGQAWPGDWLPDGRLAYTHEDRLHLMSPATGRRTSFASPRRGRLVRTAAVSPDGGRIAFQVHRDGMWMLHLQDGSMRRVLDDPTAEEFAWAPSGSHVAYHSRRAGQWRLWMAPAD
jgi:Tol biopolymer transport system component